MDLTGQKYNRWTVLEEAGSNKYGQFMWKCECECGIEKVVVGCHLRSGASKSCGCLKNELTVKRLRKDLTGLIFNRWTVLKYDYTENRITYWKCECDCGTIKSVQGCSLKNGASKSCGCLKKEMMEKRMGENHPMFGKHHSEKAKKQMSESWKGRSVWNKGLTGLIDNRILIGKDCYSWNPNLTDEDRQDRRIVQGYKDWRESVYERDNYTCQKCGDNKGGNLNAHHIESYRSNPELRTEVANGITLCEDCHKDFHHQYGYGGNTKEQWNEFIKGGTYNGNTSTYTPINGNA